MDRLKELLPKNQGSYKRNSKREGYASQQKNEQNYDKYSSVHASRSRAYFIPKDF